MVNIDDPLTGEEITEIIGRREPIRLDRIHSGKAYPAVPPGTYRELCISAVSDTEVEIRVVGLDGKTRTCKLTVE